jgi:hypothetical protein
MIDFSPIREKEIPWPEFAAKFSRPDLAAAVNTYYDQIEALVVGCTDADVVFVPVDPEAHDPYAREKNNEDLAWNLGHVIAHVIASNEESAFIAAELARGVDVLPRRSRYEVPWQEVTTIIQVRRLLAQSRRMILGTLDVWPDEPFLKNYYETTSSLKVTPQVRFLFGFSHCDSHMEQIEEIVRQAKAAR